MPPSALSYPSIQSFFQKEVGLDMRGEDGLRGRGERRGGDGFSKDVGECGGSVEFEGGGWRRDGGDGGDGIVGRGNGRDAGNGGNGEEKFGGGGGDGGGDGFTEEELIEAVDPLTRKWNPSREYENLGVGELVPGPKAVTFIGRVVSFTTIIGKSAKQPRARGWHYTGVRGEGGVVSVKLYFANQPYPLKLGQLLSIWTAFISDTSKSDGAPTSGILVCANLFPGRNTSDHIMIHTHSGASDVCRIPLGYIKGEPLPGLMTIEAYLNGGYDGILDIKLLVCVKSIGARKKIIKKDGGESDLIEVILFDHTGETKMKCWSDLIESVKEWQPGKSILLISNPMHKLDYGGKGVIAFGRNTMVDVEPEFPDAIWLKKWAIGLLRKESIGITFPSEVWGEEEVEKAIYGSGSALFSLKDIDERVRSGDGEGFTGWINVVILEMALVKCWRRNMLLCTECCGIPIYSNTPVTPCPHCKKSLTLKLNSKIITTLLDESGCVNAGKLVWSEKAWRELLGRNIEGLCEMRLEEVRLLEWRMGGVEG
ncbi:hypothetical protein SS1G_01010 [Sclerotinia sclerotiorum 1980 UF-70]|uniref:Uncharacterized protein n=1 Tax=Sclerotinia sclerotiorum (strain ATCC 18683 / 1980 / Ss-1) TaxID=665079 RepID=A7E6T5_SCLS1|nr:hypothetical protein SS1G_01010 [Sclerotinia sclerotiorum 1980 UF-70]EDN91607.1 hypothetical protein SS1G_01010 [Sclerotinia sclerotiorum 1980 UF-70]